MKQELRGYQLGVKPALREGYAKGLRRGLLVLPTGGGKTTVAADLIDSTIDRARLDGDAPAGCILFIAHRKELIDQASKRLVQFGIQHGVVMASHSRYMPWLPVQVCSIQTLARRTEDYELAAFKPKLMIVDEAHRAKADIYLDALHRWPEAHVLGLTATPWRTDGRGLADLFEFSYVASTPAELIKLSWLVPFRGFTCEMIDTSELKVSRSTGDYSEPSLEVAANKSRINGKIVEQWLAHAAGMKTVVFAATIAHSRAIIEKFVAAGVRAEHLDGTTPKGEREAILARLESGETTVVSNVGVLTEGWDLPALQCVILARPTKSLALYLQMVGRGSRPSPGKEYVRIHDHAGLMLQHGLPDETRDYSLQTSAPVANGAPRIRTCPECTRICLVTEENCPECGFMFASAAAAEGGGRQIEMVDTAIIDLDEVRRRRERLDEIRRRIKDRDRAGEFARLLSLASRKQYDRAWAEIQYRRTFGEHPSFSAEELAAAPRRRYPIISPSLLREGAHG